MSLFSSWLNGSSEEPTNEKRKSSKVYNTFNDISPTNSFGSTIPFPSNMLSPGLSINSTDSGPILTPSLEHVGIDIYETYNTSGKNLSFLRGSTELQNMTPTPANSTKCCQLCRKLYKEDENSEWACKYHRGKYQGSTTFTSFATLKRWSCCFKEAENSEGCTAGRHQEDHRATGILNTFNVANESTKNESITTSAILLLEPSQTNKTYEDSGIDLKEKRKVELKHHVEKDDTLQRLAVKYNVSVSSIKRANKLFNEQIFGKTFLIIPPEIE